MKLYNTLTRQIEEITPLQAPTVTVYTCGPTVYDYPHIGNWFTFIRYDLLIRTLRMSGFEPKWVLNITDVGHLVSDADEGEDKLEKGAKREGKTAWDVAKFYADYFTEGLKRLNFTQPHELPKATEHIAEQIQLVKELEAKGFTYVIDDGVYYDTSKFPKYADFARLDLDEQQAGARVEVNAQKRNPTDFALWKFSPKDHQRDMEWDSPWGKGFPGWHLECSAMSRKYLGDTLDIHSGGIDHVPVHHTNEIAQSEAATGKPFANVWMHTNHILINDEKISKSLNNGITLEDIEAKGFSLEAFRLHVLESHYRSQSKFSWESLEAAQNRLKAYQQMADMVYQPTTTGEKLDKHKWRMELEASIQNDLDTPKFLAVVSALSAHVTENGIHNEGEAEDLQFLFHLIDEVLGTNLFWGNDITEEQKQIIAEREKARENKDWAKSDELRDQLTEQGIGLNDMPNGTIWFRL
ncbi:MAG TPA: cysteine--tRNA ligase [Candidatus Saccharimonadales bacterium]|nr:cysteine--tRNA ligase [Candidatus Saccharimonadales bacterium]